MELSEVEALVREAAASEQLSADVRRAQDGYLKTKLRHAADVAVEHSAMLYTTGVEGFT